METLPKTLTRGDGQKITAIATLHDPNDDWAMERKRHVTASEIPRITGWSPYPAENKNPNLHANRNLLLGVRLEPVVMSELAENIPHEIQWNKHGHLFKHPAVDYLAATPDGAAFAPHTGELTATIEIKTTTAHWGSSPPPWVRIQAAIAASVLAAPDYIIAWWQADGQQFAQFHYRIYETAEPIRIAHDLTLNPMRLAAEAQARRQCTHTSHPTQLDDQDKKLVTAYKKTRRIAKKLKQREQMLRKRLEASVPNNGEYSNADGETILRRRQTTRRTFSVTDWRAAHGDDEYRKWVRETVSTYYDTP